MVISTLPFGIRARQVALARQLPAPPSPFVVQALERAHAAVSEPFVGITTDGHTVPGLFSLQPTGVSTEPLKVAAEAFLASLDEARRATASFALNDSGWQRWNNTHPSSCATGSCSKTSTPVSASQHWIWYGPA